MGQGIKTEINLISWKQRVSPGLLPEVKYLDAWSEMRSLLLYSQVPSLLAGQTIALHTLHFALPALSVHGRLFSGPLYHGLPSAWSLSVVPWYSPPPPYAELHCAPDSAGGKKTHRMELRPYTCIPKAATNFLETVERELGINPSTCSPEVLAVTFHQHNPVLMLTDMSVLSFQEPSSPLS